MVTTLIAPNLKFALDIFKRIALLTINVRHKFVPKAFVFTVTERHVMRSLVLSAGLI